MKRSIILAIECIYNFIEKTLVFFFYGRHRQNTHGWRGQFARLMANNYVKQDVHSKSRIVLDRIKEYYPELIKSSKSYLRWDYSFRLSHALFGSEVDDWFEHRFFEKSLKYKMERMTFWRNKFFNDYVNKRDDGYTSILDNKAEFATHWNSYYGRKWCSYSPNNHDFSKSSLKSFEGKRIIVKPIDSYGGNGVRVFEPHQFSEAYAYIVKQTYSLIIEEYYFQSGRLHDLNQSSLNTVRVTTLAINNRIDIIYAELRIGRKGSVVDNSFAGGSFYYIDIPSGHLTITGDYQGRTIDKFPDGTPIDRFVIPKWDEVKQYCISAHKHAPSGINLIGWDVCISDDNMLMIEGNANPAAPIFYYGIHNPWKFSKKYMDELERTVL